MYYNGNHDIDKVIKFKLNLQSHKIIIPMKYLYIHIFSVFKFFKRIHLSLIRFFLT